MIYEAAIWHHDFPTEPIESFAELDGNRWELRKVERFANGRLQYADAHRQCGDTFLSSEALPTLLQINSDPEFTARSISVDKFEALWHQAVKTNV